MTLRFIVGRMLRALIELAEHDADAELVDALHDALDVATPRRRRTEGVIETRGPGPGLRRLATFRRAERQVGGGPGSRLCARRVSGRVGGEEHQATGRVKAQLSAKSVVVLGKVNGSIRASDGPVARRVNHLRRRPARPFRATMFVA